MINFGFMMEENNIHSHVHNERVYNRGVSMLRSPERTERLEAEQVVKLCISENIHSILDIGTGSALFAEAFSKQSLRVAGVDTNPEMIEAAQRYVPEGDFRLAAAENLPFEDNFFDMTFFGVVFHEVDDYSKALKEAFRVSTIGTSILEWKYKKEDFGPPLEHRLKPDFIKKLAEETGYKSFRKIGLKNLVLYKLTK
jgi:ubiquinone/menaquinone biosynthesis C-methylase UbiE